MRSWKSGSIWKTRRRASWVWDHQAVEVRRGRKWSRVRWEKGRPIRSTGRKSQPKGKLDGRKD